MQRTDEPIGPCNPFFLRLLVLVGPDQQDEQIYRPPYSNPWPLAKADLYIYTHDGQRPQQGREEEMKRMVSSPLIFRTLCSFGQVTEPCLTYDFLLFFLR